MNKFLTLLSAFALAVQLCAAGNVAVLPGAQYVLRNVATGTYLMKDGTTTSDEQEASNWRVITNDTIFTDSPSELYYVYCDDAIMQLNNSGLGWSCSFSPKANTTYIMPSETTEGAFKFRYRHLTSTRFLNVEVDADGKETLTAARTSSPWNDWEFVATSHPKDYRYRLMSMNRSSGDTRYCIAYLSRDHVGEPIWLSGWMAVPTKSEGGLSDADHVLFTAHYTMAKHTQWPTEKDPVEAYSFTFTSNKPVMVNPDYLGCGITAQYDNPFLAADIMAEECTDMLFAAHELLLDLHGMDCSTGTYPTYGIGSSQGGSIILATQRYVENSPALTDAQRQAIHWVRTCACDGAYNPLASLSNYIYTDNLSMPSVAILLIIGMVASYPDIFAGTQAEEYFSDEFLQAGILEAIRSHEYENSEITTLITKACGNSMYAILSDEARDMNSDLIQKLMKALGRNNITRDWSPQADIVLYYNPNDEVVPHLNCVSACNGLKERCQGAFETKQTSIGYNHSTTCIEFYAKMIFGAYK